MSAPAVRRSPAEHLTQTLDVLAGVFLEESILREETVMNDEPKAAALARVEQSLGVHGAVVADVLGRLWEESFEQGRLAALDELQDRFCVCMK
ncbi:MAG TPA: hypothetical protein VMU94_19935 [Streptosporangiaceae bacterium]|nr:hypothetical protein [Streptosporangiaceae bacterium]